MAMSLKKNTGRKKSKYMSHKVISLFNWINIFKATKKLNNKMVK